MGRSKKNIKLLFSIILIAFGISVFAQKNIEIDSSFLKEVHRTYNTAKSYQMEIEVSMLDKNENLAYPSQKNISLKSDENFYIETHELTSIKTSEFQLLIDHISKEVRYTALKSKLKEKLSIIPDFSTLNGEVLEIYERGEFTLLNFKENLQFKKTTYTFNTASKLLEQVDYYSDGTQYGQPAHIKIVYTTSNFNKAVDTSIFQLENYLVNQEEKLVLNEVYKTYSLINNTVIR